MKISQRTFTAGEVSHEIGARADFAKYSEALETCRNFFVKTQGGVYNRAGTRYAGEVDDSTVQHRLIPFSFNTEQTYILDFGHLTMRVIMDGAYVLSGGTPYTLTTPFAATDLFNLRYSQTADVMTITGHGYDPQELNRLAHDNWAIGAINFASSVSVPTGVTLVTTGSGAGSYSKTYRYVVTAFDADSVESLGSTEVSITTPSLSTTAGVRVSWTAVTGATAYRVYKDPSNGSGVHGYIGDVDGAMTSFDDFNFAPDTTLTPPKDNQPFTGASDKPMAVGFYQQRRVFANTVNHPQRVFITQTGVLDSLRRSSPTRDTDAIESDVISRQVNEIRHIVDQDMMILLTAGAELRVTEGIDYVLTPSTFGVRVTSRYGTSDVTPAIAGDTVVFIQEQGSRIVGVTASGIDVSGQPTLLAQDLSIVSRHLFDGYTIVDMAYEKEPYGILWMVRDDGTIVGLTYQREQKVWGMHRHDTDGLIKSVACISESGRTATYLLVQRTINSVSKLYVERMEPREETNVEDAFYVDCGLTYTGAATTSITGLSHLEGKTLAVLADGNVVNGLTVSGGAITLPTAASKVHAGLPYTCEITTLAIDDNVRTQLGRKKTVSELAVRFYRSRGGWIGPKDGTLQELRPRTAAAGYDAIPLYTEEKRVAVRRGWDEGGQVTIRQTDPLPMAILAVTPDVDIE